MSTKKVLNHSAILSELKSSMGEKTKGRNNSNNNGNNFITKINTLDKHANTIKTLKHSFINDKTFSGSDTKEKRFKENSFQNNKIDIKISINNYGKQINEKKNDNNSILKDSMLYKPKNNISIPNKKNESLETDILMHSTTNASLSNLEKKFKISQQPNYSKYSPTLFQSNSKVNTGSNNSFAFNPKLRNNYTSTSHPPLKTDVTESRDEKPRNEASFHQTGDNFGKEFLNTEPCMNSGGVPISKTYTCNSTKLNAIEAQLDLIMNKTLDKKPENLNDKLNIYKNAFDDIIKAFSPEMSRVLNKVHNGYIEVVQKLISRLNSKTSEVDSLNTSKTYCKKEFSNLSKKYDDQQEEIRFLKLKISDQHKVSENSTNLPSQNASNLLLTKPHAQTIGDFLKNEHNEYISSMNKNNINDLEALYFVDKVQMRSNSVSDNKIPKLDFNIFNQDAAAQQMKTYEEYKKLQQKQKVFNEKTNISPIKTFIKEPDRLIHNKSQVKKLTINNPSDTTFEKDKIVKISNNTTKNTNFNPFKN